MSRKRMQETSSEVTQSSDNVASDVSTQEQSSAVLDTSSDVETSSDDSDASDVETSSDDSDTSSDDATSSVELSEEQRATLDAINARLASLSEMLSATRSAAHELRAMRAVLTNDHSVTEKREKVERVVKSEEQKKIERLDYRFARRYAKKNKITIDDARALLAAGKIKRNDVPERVVIVDASSEVTSREHIDAALAKLLAMRDALADAASHADAQSLADAVDAKLSASSETVAA